MRAVRVNQSSTVKKKKKNNMVKVAIKKLWEELESFSVCFRQSELLLNIRYSFLHKKNRRDGTWRLSWKKLTHHLYFAELKKISIKKYLSLCKGTVSEKYLQYYISLCHWPGKELFLLYLNPSLHFFICVISTYLMLPANIFMQACSC